ncbi:ABC transporter substrate-binding protein [Caballeronia sp. LZ001]|uniref:ABC transporter substrate-binding protein n=1 Tax=Caballeronia sp. LZ001 TaxID=3038553 RepID=UPI002859C9DD|nr:ABC transporter substrate-binding protein [Caballeronia sp. LZ001]MDR5806197.1 ABC transporter substrate-binding protein [Caballeronia sp. LZ001]
MKSPPRRTLLQGAAALLAFSRAARVVAGPAPRRIVVLNWELTETLLALGRAPVGIPLPAWYANTIAVPPLPSDVADIGLLYQPNFDALLALAPDLLIVTPAHAGLLAPLRRIAPTLTLGAYMTDGHPYASLCAETRVMADAFDARARADALFASTERVMSDIAARVPRGRPVIVADVIDERHLRVYGAGSLFNDVLAKIGLSNAATARVRWTTNAMGSTVVPLPRLLEAADADIALTRPLAPDIRAALTASPLWRALPAVREKRVAVLPVIAPYGGLISMQRFATAMANARTIIDNGGGGLA